MLRLMIVDDEEIIREALSEMIDYEAIGYQLIATAGNGMEAYDIICDEYPDVVITDIRMPFLNGLELIERSVKADSRITFILLSGYSEFEYAKQAMKYGVRQYLLKPTDKQELIEALIAIRDEREQEERQKQEEQHRLLCELHSPFEQCFVMEALEHQEDFKGIFNKYKALLSFPRSRVTACICSFVEERYLKNFAADVGYFLNSWRMSLLFPMIYVKNSAVMVMSDVSLENQDRWKENLGGLQYSGQAVPFAVGFLHADTTEELFRNILHKISRYERILLADGKDTFCEIRNNIAAPWRIDRMVDDLLEAMDKNQAAELLDTIFTGTLPIDDFRNMALGLFLKLNSADENQTLELACDFFRRLYSCSDINSIRELMQVVLVRRTPEGSASKASANISLLKTYVERHLNSENLSLKWLAENYLFVSVGYLNKQFVKEEGLRFSDYLNRKRMEEAERLMVYYHGENVKNIARQVGFGNNPQYFSQVFKKYIGLTPTEYIERLKQ